MFHISMIHYLVLASILFTVGVCGIFLNRKNVIVILMSIELMLVAVNLNFITFSHYLNDLVGMVFVIFIYTLAASEVAIGLAILVIYYKNRGNIDIEDANRLKG